MLTQAFTNGESLRSYCQRHNTSIWETMIAREIKLSERTREEIVAEMYENLNVMRDAVYEGLHYKNASVSGLTGGDSEMLYKYSKNDIYLDNLNLEFINDFEIYLRTNCNFGVNMTAKMIQFLKKVVNLARNIGIIGFDPFFQHQSKWAKVNIEYLTKQEIKKIVKKELPIKRMDVVRDIFLFRVFTGLSYIDIKNLTINNI